jgi:predicted RNase H-like HicB family nuclease
VEVRDHNYWSAEDAAYIAEVPELAGCAADGVTYRKALSNAEVVIREWIETARVLRVTIDYESRRGDLLFDLWVGDPESLHESVRERYRRGTLSLRGLHFWVVEPPATELAEANADTPWLTADGPLSEASSLTAKALASATPASASGWYFFFSNWNAFAYFAADEVCFAWA